MHCNREYPVFGDLTYASVCQLQLGQFLQVPPARGTAQPQNMYTEDMRGDIGTCTCAVHVTLISDASVSDLVKQFFQQIGVW